MTKKEQILHTALALFAAQGYDRTATSRIAREAGVSEGLIFRHYENKAGLLEAILDEGLRQIAGTMEGYRLIENPRAAVLDHIRRSFILIREQEAFWRLAQMVRFQPEVRAGAAAKLEAINGFIVRQLAEQFSKLGARAPQQEALTLFALIDGICIQWLQAPEQYPLEDMKDHLINKYRHEQYGLG